jgi:hypothetical protein
LSISGIHNKGFKRRLDVTEVYTSILVKYLEKVGHFKLDRKATKDEDMQDGIDFWVRYGDEEESTPIQFKLRDTRRDIPVCRYQPLYGIDDPENKVGRDFRCLMNGKSKHYYVASRNESGHFCLIYRLSSDKLKGLVNSLDEEWRAVTDDEEKMYESRSVTCSHNFFTAKNVGWMLSTNVRNKLVFSGSNQGQIWWKKNRGEAPKLNMYLPQSFRDEAFSIPSTTGAELETVFYKLTADNGTSGRLD